MILLFNFFEKEIDMKSRSNIRKKQRIRNYVLNSLIGVVVVLILIVGGNLIFNDNNTATESQQAQVSSADEREQDEQDDNVQITEDEDTDQNTKASANQEDDEQQQSQENNGNKNERESQQDENENDDQKEGNESEQEENEANSNKIDEPIGTSQTGEHTSSYEEGSVDWNEKIKAIQLATGLDDNMTLWRLENGGGPQKSVGKVSPEGVQDWMYVVNLQWVDQEGWKVTDVDKQER